jgi:glycerate kinase
LAALGAAIRPGAAAIAELISLAPAVAAADLVIVGEGRLDEQTPHGKAISEVMAVAAHAGVPVLAVCGQITLGEPELRALGLAGWATAPGRDPESAAQAVADATRTLLARPRFSR